jgi:hypothetical protein
MGAGGARGSGAQLCTKTMVTIIRPPQRGQQQGSGRGAAVSAGTKRSNGATFSAALLGALAGGIHDLADLVGASADLLEERLDGASGWPQRFSILEGLLAERLSRHRAGHRLVQAAWAEIERQRGNIRIGDLAARLD